MEGVGRFSRSFVIVILVAAAGCTSAPPPIPPPMREQVRPIELGETGLACLDLAPEVVAAHHERAAMFGASSCDIRALDYAGAFGLIGAVAALGIASSCAGPEDGYYVDVASIVRNRFVNDLSPKAVTSRIELPAACPAGDSVTALRESFGDKPVIDFKTVDWQRATADQMTVFIPSTIRGRLVDTKNGQILWEEACTVSQDHVAANLTEVRDTLEASAERCGEQFAERFSRPRQTN